MSPGPEFARRERVWERGRPLPVVLGHLPRPAVRIPHPQVPREGTPRPRPVLGQVPPFTMTDQFGHPFGSGDLAGRSYLASFAFTTCPTTCPALMEACERSRKGSGGSGGRSPS